MFCKKGVLRNFTNSQENICARVKLQAARVSFLIKLQVCSCFALSVPPENIGFPMFSGGRERVQVCNFIKKETLAKVFSCGFCEISTNTFFQRTPLVAALPLVP